jgi:hypothetical protein
VSSRRLFVLAALSLSACNYPEFGFATDAADSADVVEEGVDSALDSAPIDSFVAEVEPETSTMDSATADSATDTGTAKDTAVADTSDATSDPCAGHLFCQRFDTASAPSDGWTGNYTTGGGVTVLDSTTSRSAPKSLRSSIPAGTVTAAATVSQTFTSPALTTKFRVECDVQLEAFTYPVASTGVVLLKVQHSSMGDGISLDVSDTGLYVEANGATYSGYTVTKTLTAKTWFHVKLEGSLHTTSGSLTLWIDDMTTPLVSKTGISTAQMDGNERQAVLGLFSYLKSAAFEAHFDNYTFDFVP